MLRRHNLPQSILLHHYNPQQDTKLFTFTFTWLLFCSPTQYCVIRLRVPFILIQLPRSNGPKAGTSLNSRGSFNHQDSFTCILSIPKGFSLARTPYTNH
jgi:hypothetical protein